MPNRIIINNRTELSDEDAMLKVLNVVQGGRVSNDGKQYCYLSSFGNLNNPDKYHVVTDLRKNCDSFTIYEPPITNK